MKKARARNQQPATSSQKPAGPAGSWPLGNTKQFAASTLGFVKECMEQYEGMAYARIALKDFYILLDLDTIDHVLRKNQRNYVKSFAYDGLVTILGKGLLTNEGDDWLQQRRTLQPVFHKVALQQLTDLMLARTAELIERWKALPPGSELNVTRELLPVTQDILTQSLFGTDQVIPEAEKIGEMLPILRQYPNDKMKNPLLPPLWVPTRGNRQFKEALATLHRIIGKIMAGEVAEGSLLAMMMDSMSPEQIRDEVLTLYLAGQETTTAALSFVFHLLGHHPEEMEKIRREMALAGPTPDPMTIQSFINLRNAIQESMRLYPPAWAVSREAVAADTLNGYTIPPGAVMFVSIYALHHSPEYWDNPESFLPDRFNEPLKEKRAWLPFGTGPRICIGNHFALMEMQLILASVLKHFHWEPVTPRHPDLITPMTLSTRDPIRIKLWPV